MERNVIERAFELAPECGSLSELQRRLIEEGYVHVNAHLSGWLIRRQILNMLKGG